MKEKINKLAERTEQLFAVGARNGISVDQRGILNLYGQCVKLFYDFTEGDILLSCIDEGEEMSVMEALEEIFHETVNALLELLEAEEQRVFKLTVRYEQNADYENYNQMLKKYGLVFVRETKPRKIR